MVGIWNRTVYFGPSLRVHYAQFCYTSHTLTCHTYLCPWLFITHNNEYNRGDKRFCFTYTNVCILAKKEKPLPVFIHFYVAFIKNKKKLGNLKFLPFSISLLIMCFIKQGQVSKLMFATLISVVYFTCFHYRLCCTIILTSTVPGVTNGIEQTRVRPLNDLILLFFRATSCHWGPMYLVDSKSSEFVV